MSKACDVIVVDALAVLGEEGKSKEGAFVLDYLSARLRSGRKTDEAGIVVFSSLASGDGFVSGDVEEYGIDPLVAIDRVSMDMYRKALHFFSGKHSNRSEIKDEYPHLLTSIAQAAAMISLRTKKKILRKYSSCIS